MAFQGFKCRNKIKFFSYLSYSQMVMWFIRRRKLVLVHHIAMGLNLPLFLTWILDIVFLFLIFIFIFNRRNRLTLKISWLIYRLLFNNIVDYKLSYLFPKVGQILNLGLWPIILLSVRQLLRILEVFIILFMLFLDLIIHMKLLELLF